MRLGINGLSDVPKHMARLDNHIVITSGFDPPAYINIRSGRSGRLGMIPWHDGIESSEWFKRATGVTVSGGSLTDGNWYSAVVVAVNGNIPSTLGFVLSQPTIPSIPVRATSTKRSITWTIPSHVQKGNVAVGFHTGTFSATVLTDTTKTFIADGLIGKTIKKLSNGATASITDNTANTITVASIADGWATGDEYQVIDDECTMRYVYVSEADTASGAHRSSVFYFQGEVDGNSPTTFSMDAMAITSGIASFDKLPPPEGMRHCTQARNKIYMVGGILERDGLAKYINTPVVHTDVTLDFDRHSFAYYTETASGSHTGSNNASVLTDSSLALTTNELVDQVIYNLTDESFGVITANTSNTITATLSGGDNDWDLDDEYVVMDPVDGFGVNVVCKLKMTGVNFSGVYRGSRLTITDGSSGTDVNILNQVVDAKILRVENDGSDGYLYFSHNNLVLQTGCVGTLTIQPNVVEGDSDTRWGEGFVGSSFAHDDATSPSVKVEWVDVANRRMGLDGWYNGGLSDASFHAYSLDGDYALYSSAVREPHAFPVDGVVPVPGRSVASIGYDRVLLIFAPGSIVKIPHENLGDGATDVDLTIGSDSPYSILLTPRGVMFYDGSGFSVTDSIGVEDLSRFRLDEYVSELNSNRLIAFRGAAIKDRVMYTFPKGDDPMNMFGVLINTSNGDFYPFRIHDANAIWAGKASDGKQKFFHGTSTRSTESGKSWVWEHDPDYPMDGLSAGDGWRGVTNGDETTYTFDVVTEDAEPIDPGSSLTTPPYQYEGVPATLLSTADYVSERHIICKKIDVIDTYAGSGNPKTLRVSVSSDFTLPYGMLASQHLFFIGAIRYSFGPKWEDFGSVQYYHSIKHLLITTEKPLAPYWCIVDHYVDGNGEDADIVKTTREFVPISKTQVKSKAWVGKCNTYGYRIRIYSPTPLYIHKITPIFTTNV